MKYSLVRGQGPPTTTNLRLSLLVLSLFYLIFAAVGSWFIARGGFDRDGDTQTLTSILAVLGAVFSLSGTALSSYSQSARMQYLIDKAIKGSVALQRIHEMDLIKKGAFSFSPKFWNLLYRFVCPAVSLLMTAVLKKAMSTGIEPIPSDTSLAGFQRVDPVDTASGVRGTAFPGAIFFNVTTAFLPEVNQLRSPGLYVAPLHYDESGLDKTDFIMPWLPPLVASGSSGYFSYLAKSVPALAVSVTCGPSDDEPWYDGQGYIGENGNNITLIQRVDKEVAVKLMFTNSVSWECTGSQGTTVADLGYESDLAGNWNLSTIATNSPTRTNFTTDGGRWQYIALVLSDALGQAAEAIGWEDGVSESTDPEYSKMLVATRMTFATALLCFSTNRTVANSTTDQDSAYAAVSRVQVLDNWALSMTTALLYLLAIMAFYHLCLPSQFRIDFTLLQAIEMQESTPKDLMAPLLGHCAENEKGVEPNLEVSIRASAATNHLGMLTAKGAESVEWVRITKTTACS